MFCWGANESGQLGNGLTSHSALPVTVTDMASAQIVTAGKAHTCALLSRGEIMCWGENYVGQLGTGDTTDSTKPVLVRW